MSIRLASVSLNRFNGGRIDAAISHLLLQRREFADQLVRILNRLLHRRADFGNLAGLGLGRTRGRSQDAVLQLADSGAEGACEALEITRYQRVTHADAELAAD